MTPPSRRHPGRTNQEKEKIMTFKKFTPAQAKAHRDKQLKEMQAKISEQVDNFRDSEEWKRYLDFAAQFHNYSARNIMLIMQQMPTATRVAGFRKWKELGRQVNKGERGLKIFGYASKKYTTKDENGEEKEEKAVFFPPVTVFDVSQTSGDELPSIAPELKEFDAERAEQILSQVSDYLNKLGWTFTTEKIHGGAYGYTTLDGTYRVVVRDDVSKTQTAKTALHELAHVILHSKDGQHADKEKPRDIIEIEAESVAYIVAGALGIDSSSYSIGYVASWSGMDTELIQDTAEQVLAAAKTILNALEEENAPAQAA